MSHIQTFTFSTNFTLEVPSWNVKINRLIKILFLSKPFPTYRLATSEGILRLKVSRDENRWEVTRLKSKKSVVASKLRNEDEVCPFSFTEWEAP